MENKKEMLSKAYKEGKIIQFNSSGEWKDFEPQNQVDRPNFDYKTDNWRIKPEVPEAEIQPEQIWNEEKREGVKKVILEHQKEETLEEAATNYSGPRPYDNDYSAFIAGAEWQAERMYTEEQLTNIARWAFAFHRRNDLSDSELEEAFEYSLEQFKKKQP